MATVTKTYKIGLSDTDKANLQSAIETRITGGQVTVGTANKAVADQNGAVIDTTYVKHNTYDQTLSVAKADIADNVSLSASDTSTKPYKFDVTGNSASADVSSGFAGALKKLQGTSVVFNQLNSNNGTTETKNGVTFTKNADGSWTVNGTATADAIKSVGTSNGIVIGHKYLIKGCASSGSASTYYMNFNGGGDSAIEYGNGAVFTQPNNEYARFISITIKNGTTVNNLKFVPQLFDLTLMFGNNYRIPNGLNGTDVLEYATDGDLDRVVSPSAIFSRLFPLPYYDYDAGTITSVKTNGKLISVGRNAFDGVTRDGYIDGSTGTFVSQANGPKTSTNFIKVIPEQVYYLGCDKTTNEKNVYEYDENKNYIKGTPIIANGIILLSPNTHYVHIKYKTNPYDSTAVAYFQLRHSGNYVGYKAYEKHELAIPSVELKGIYGGVGDTYESSGKKIVKFASVDLGTLTWAIQSGGTANERAVATLTGVYSESVDNVGNIVCSKYSIDTANNTYLHSKDKTISISGTGIQIYDSTLIGKTGAEIKALLNGVMCVYQLNTPTETDETQFTETFYEDDMGTIEFEQPSVGNYSPVGHQTSYQPNASDMIQNTKSRVDTIETKIAGLPFSGISGYDATKSQHLEQHSGTLVWVDNE